jgi:hypothetical protein
MTSLGASIVTEKGGHRVVLSVDETTLETPPLEHLIFYAGLGVLVAVNIVELPVALAVGAGHVLIELTKRPGLDEFAEVLEAV